MPDVTEIEKIQKANEEHARKYPEHAKLLTDHARHTAAREFYDFLIHDKDLHFGKHHTHDDTCTVPGKDGWPSTLGCGLSSNYLNAVHIPPEDLLAEFLGIDRNKLEDEKRAMLEELAAANSKGGAG